MHRSFGSFGSGRPRRRWAAPLAAALAIGGGGALLFGGVTAFAHDVTSIAGTVTCAGVYSISVTGDVYTGANLVVTLGSGPTGNVSDAVTGQTAGGPSLSPYGPFTGSGATVGEAITAYPSDNSSNVASNTLVGPVGGCSATTATTVIDAATGLTWSGSETTGASAYDTATVTISDGSTPSGTVSYSFFSLNDTCAGTPGATDTVTLNADGSVPNSTTEGPLAPGSYAFQATYWPATYWPSGVNEGAINAEAVAGWTSTCEPFTVRGTSTTATVVVQSGTATGSSAHDTATVTTSDTVVASGTVTYTFFSNGTCDGTGTAAGTVDLSRTGAVSNSNTEGPPLAAGSYSFRATYSGDLNYGGSTSTCEPFTVGRGTSTTATVVVQSGPATGSSAHDTATVTTSDTVVASGTVTYTFFTNGACSGTGTGAGGGALVSGAAPNSSTEGPLAAGSYAFQATYSGDSNYAGSTSGCEPFTVGEGTSSITTAVKDAATGLAWSGSEAIGASAYDTATVTTSDTVTATGTVAYTFFTNGACSGTGTGAGGGALVSGAVLNSNTEESLAAGSYAFQATYSGDSNYAGSTSACEPFSVPTGSVLAATSTKTATTVIDAATKAAWSGSETTGASAYDTATVTTSNGFTATGTVSYSFFSNGTCAGTPSAADTVTLTAAGLVPNSKTEGPLAAGSYAFQATYSGNSSYGGSTSACEPFSAATSTSTPTRTPTGAVAGITTPSTGAGSTAGGWGWLSLILVLVGGALLAGQWMLRRPKIKVQDII
jgi:hypothetical protein